ncbi:hypothetical protein [Phenylobacterium sp.]|uniref:hypothetical protein n=1 Tax=Phenylobacterium sp. TaxID=1871053 RepID=UPI0039839865
MNGFSASEAALEGFRLTRERPGAILAWSGLYAFGMAIIAFIMVTSLGEEAIAIARKGQLGPEDIDAIAGRLAQSAPAFVLILVLAVALMSILTAGIYRLVLRPGEKGFAHLRLGGDELRLTAVNLVLFGVGMVCLLAGFIAAAAAEQAAPGMAVVAAAVVGALTIWVGVRLSMVTPMTFAARRITLGPAWELTRGAFWPLLGMIVLAVIFYVMIWLLITIIGIAIINLSGGQQAMTDVSAMGPMTLIATLVTVVMQLLLSVLQVVMIYAPFAVAYQQLHGDAPANPLRNHVKAD